MESGVKDYIKRMFAMGTTPTWSGTDEGLIFYDKSAHKWVTGNNEGWQVLDRGTTVLSNDIVATKWIDAFEYPTTDILNNNYITSSSGILNPVTAKSVILDIADNWGDDTFIALRQVDFYLGDDKIIVNVTNYTAYETSKYDTTRWAKFAFDTTLSKIGGGANTAWLSANGSTTNQRIICVFDSEQTFDSIIINNGHGTNTGGGTESNRGSKNVKIYISSDEITSTTYDETISNSNLLFDGEFDQHIASNIEDPQILELLPATWINPLNIFIETELTTYGNYSLRGEASISKSKNFSLTKHFSPAINVTTQDDMRFDIRSSRVGTNLQLQIYNIDAVPSGVIAHDIHINTKDIFQSELINISTISGSYNTLAFKVLNDDLENTFYIDNMYFGIGPLNWVDAFEYPTDELVRDNYSAGQQNVTAKSIIIDITDNWGDASYLEFRSIEFFLQDTLIDVTSEFTAYGTFYAATLEPDNIFDTSTSKVGDSTDNEWVHTGASSVRTSCVFDAPITFDKIIVNNGHHSGTLTTRGFKNTKIFTSSDSITSIVYDEAINNSTLVFDGIIDQHVASNDEDDQLLSLINVTASGIISLYSENIINTYGEYSLKCIASVSGSQNEEITKTLSPSINFSDQNYLKFDIQSSKVGSNIQFKIFSENSVILGSPVTLKSIILDIADNWSNVTYNYMIFRSLELLDMNNSVISMDQSDYTVYSTSCYSEVSYATRFIFDTNLSKTGSIDSTSWLSATGQRTNQRIICVFNNPITIYGVTVNNGHHSGDRTTCGLRNVKITTSTDQITSTLYNDTITNSTIIYDDEMRVHVTGDEADDDPLELINAYHTHDINTLQSNKFTTEVINVSTISGSYSNVGFKVLNDDLENTFYIDKMYTI